MINDKETKKKINIKKFKDLEGKFLLVKVGTIEEPADDKQIKEIQDKLIALFEKNGVNCLTFVTHHAVDIEIIEQKNTTTGV